MIFPSLFAHVETGLISQISAYIILGFSFLINYFKKIVIIGLLVFISLITFSRLTFAVAAPGVLQSLGQRNLVQYYGSPYGNYPLYPYPGLPYHALMGPSPYYFRPYGPSPYQPVDCVTCMMRYQQFSSPYPGMNNMMMTNVFKK